MNRQRRDPLRKLQEASTRLGGRRDLRTAGPEGGDLDPHATVDLDLAADSDVSVLLTAHNGTHRAAWARTVHDRSARWHGPFVPVCGHAVPDAHSVIPVSDVNQWFESAAGGTLFIDHVWALSIAIQGRLLSFITQQSLARTGTMRSNGDRHVRIISGTDRSLLTCIAAGAFSEELFYRLNVIHVDITANFSRRAS